MTIQVFQPSLSADELASVARTFNSNWPGKGPRVDEFEAAWAKHINASPANVVSVNSCTEGLFTAVQLLGIGPGDEVIIPTIHFVGAAQAVLSVGAKPVFCDVDSRTLNTTADDIWSKRTPNTKAVILNHYGGAPCQMDEIKQWCERGNISIIEDAACAPASTYNGQAVGAFGDIGVWSFDSMKIISTGDGGMMYIRDKELADKARKQLYLGTSEGSGLSSDKARWWEFEVEIAGARRSVMNDIAAGIGLEQLKKMDGFIARRYEIMNKYLLGFGENHDIANCSQVFFFDGDNQRSSHYFFWIQTPRRDELARYLKGQGVYTTFRYYPLHWAYKTGDSLPNAEKAARETLLLPLHCGLTDDQVQFICDTIKDFFEN
jgi:aminotransferase